MFREFSGPLYITDAGLHKERIRWRMVIRLFDYVATNQPSVRVFLSRQRTFCVKTPDRLQNDSKYQSIESKFIFVGHENR